VSINAPFLSVPMTPSVAMSNFGGRRYHCFSVMQFWCPHGLQGWVCELSMDAPFYDNPVTSSAAVSSQEILLFLSPSTFSYSWQLLSSIRSVFMSRGLQICRQNRPLSSQLYTIVPFQFFSQICKNMCSISEVSTTLEINCSPLATTPAIKLKLLYSVHWLQVFLDITGNICPYVNNCHLANGCVNYFCWLFCPSFLLSCLSYSLSLLSCLLSWPRCSLFSLFCFL
jgi:hypothetical protein